MSRQYLGMILCSAFLMMFLLSACGGTDSAVKIIEEVPESGSVVEKPEENETQNAVGETDKMQTDETDEDKVQAVEQDKILLQTEPSNLIWVTYWDMDTAVEQLRKNREAYDAIGMFAAYYDEAEQVFIPDNMIELKEQLKGNGILDNKTTYLTVVNDQLHSSGNRLKDTQLLYDLIGSEELAQSHAKQLVQLASDHHYDGLEIDYEAIREDARLWDHFITFLKILVQESQEAGLKLRVLLEPSAPTGDYDWPGEIEYVMMCYNLHGYGTTPGPKADPAFLEEMIRKMEQIGATINFALANDGFDFTEDGSEQIREKDCLSLIEQYGVEPVRDENSLAMMFGYTDADGISHEVWYADDETIHGWKKVITGSGYERFSLWRL